MFLRNRMNDRKAVLRLGMACLLLFFALSWFGRHPASDFWEGFVDGLRGALLGAAIVLNLWAARRAGRSRCTGES